MKLRKATRDEKLIFWINVAYIIFFLYAFYAQVNYEFILYILSMVGLLVVLSFLQLRYNFRKSILLGLTIAGIMHLSGGFTLSSGSKVYDLYVIYPSIKYDNLVHLVGYFVAALMVHFLLKQYTHKKVKEKWVVVILSILVVCGVGAVNEVIEFFAFSVFSNVGVGGYENNMWDLTANLLGAVLANLYIRIRKW